MRFLVVDPNLAFGWTVRDFLQEHVHDAVVDLAQNVSILRRRLADHKYDLVMADIMNAVDREDISTTLEQLDVPLIMWSFINPGHYGTFAQQLHARLVTKPRPEDLDNLLELVGCPDEQAKVHVSTPDAEGRTGETAL